MNYTRIYIILMLLAWPLCQAKPLITNPDRSDGFGAQFQTIIYSVIYAELAGFDFVYTPFNVIEHNYDNDPEFVAKKEWIINFKDNFEPSKGKCSRIDAGQVIQFFERNLISCAQSEALKNIKRIFRANKDKSLYFNDRYFNIVIHVRRHNPHDNRIYGTDTPDDLFLNIIDKLRVVYASKKPLFHIQSQGNVENFKKFYAPDIVLHLNETVENSFISMVLADALVTSPSSYSYTAAVLSDGVIYYMPFWHPPLPGWIPVNEM